MTGTQRRISTKGFLQQISGRLELAGASLGIRLLHPLGGLIAICGACGGKNGFERCAGGDG
jgi:hypothetical protein